MDTIANYKFNLIKINCERTKYKCLIKLINEMQIPAFIVYLKSHCCHNYDTLDNV